MFNQFIEKVQEELSSLTVLEKQLRSRQKQYPASSLNVMIRYGKSVMYYEYDRDKKQKYPSGKYLNRNNFKRACLLAQKEYEMKYLDCLHMRIDSLEYLLDKYSASEESKMLETIHPEKAKLIQPLFSSDEDFINKWYQANPGELNSFPIKNEYPSNRGEITRSKSEKIIADILNDFDVPYVYEPRIQLSSGKFFYPDFKVLNVKLRKEFIWEHFGKLGDSGYSMHMCDKFNQLVSAGYFPGESFLLTCESSDNGINVNSVKSLVQKYLK